MALARRSNKTYNNRSGSARPLAEGASHEACTLALAFVALLADAHVRRSGQDNPVVVMETSMGNIKIELFEDKAPITVKNFLNYVDDKHYDGTIFHRVIPDFMIQGGGFEPGMKEKKTKRPDQERVGQRPVERARHHRHGPHQRARQRHRPVLHQRRGQRLPRPRKARDGVGYCVFGKVIEGMDVVDKIKAVEDRRRRAATRTCRSRTWSSSRCERAN